MSTSGKYPHFKPCGYYKGLFRGLKAEDVETVDGEYSLHDIVY